MLLVDAYNHKETVNVKQIKREFYRNYRSWWQSFACKHKISMTHWSGPSGSIYRFNSIYDRDKKKYTIDIKVYLGSTWKEIKKKYIDEAPNKDTAWSFCYEKIALSFTERNIYNPDSFCLDIDGVFRFQRNDSTGREEYS